MNPTLLAKDRSPSAPAVALANGDTNEWSRRSFLKGTAGAVGLLIALQLSNNRVRAAASPATGGQFSPNAFLRIAPDNTVTIIINHSEMGQGIVTALSMLVAEELDLDWSKVRTEFAPVAPAYNLSYIPVQMTGGSSSTWSEFDRFRFAGATARALLLQAAAKRWSVPAAECHTEPGEIVHAGGQRASFGSLAEAAAKLTPPQTVPLKDSKNFRLIGKPMLRLDSRSKVTGTAQFGIDTRLPVPRCIRRSTCSAREFRALTSRQSR